ncbi:UNVERIFIED_ORG: hypothetical protein GGE63_003340 [Rhizobium esperanzae]
MGAVRQSQGDNHVIENRSAGEYDLFEIFELRGRTKHASAKKVAFERFQDFEVLHGETDKTAGIQGIGVGAAVNRSRERDAGSIYGQGHDIVAAAGVYIEDFAVAVRLAIDDGVIACPAFDDVVARSGIDPIITGATVQNIVAVSSYQHVVTAGGLDVDTGTDAADVGRPASQLVRKIGMGAVRQFQGDGDVFAARTVRVGDLVEALELSRRSDDVSLRFKDFEVLDRYAGKIGGLQFVNAGSAVDCPGIRETEEIIPHSHGVIAVARIDVKDYISGDATIAITDHVVACTAPEDVISGVAANLVVAFAAVQLVISGIAPNDVVACACCDRIITIRARHLCGNRSELIGEVSRAGT